MVNIAKIGTQAMSKLKSGSLAKYANNPKQFNPTLGNLKALKMHEPPKADVVNFKVTGEVLKEIAPKLAKEPPVWKKVIGKIFG